MNEIQKVDLKIRIQNGKLYLKRTYWFWLNASDNDNSKLLPQKEEGITKVKYFSSKKFKKIRGNTFQSIHDVLSELCKHLKS